MSGFFGVISKTDCVEDVFYGTDYHSHLGTKRAGMVFIVPGKGFRRSIHNLENSYFRNKFEDELTFSGNSGLGVISDTDPQPILFNSHLGHFAIVTVSLSTVMMCSIHITVMPSSSLIRRTILIAGSSSSGLNPASGSSRSSIRGRVASARASSTIFLSVRFRLDTGRSPSLPRPTNPSISCPRRLASAAPRRPPSAP